MMKERGNYILARGVEWLSLAVVVPVVLLSLIDEAHAAYMWDRPTPISGDIGTPSPGTCVPPGGTLEWSLTNVHDWDIKRLILGGGEYGPIENELDTFDWPQGYTWLTFPPGLGTFAPSSGHIDPNCECASGTWTAPTDYIGLVVTLGVQLNDKAEMPCGDQCAYSWCRDDGFKSMVVGVYVIQKVEITGVQDRYHAKGSAVDMTINYTIYPTSGFTADSAELNIKNNGGTVAYTRSDLDKTGGSHTTTWPASSMNEQDPNQSPFIAWVKVGKDGKYHEDPGDAPSEEIYIFDVEITDPTLSEKITLPPVTVKGTITPDIQGETIDWWTVPDGHKFETSTTSQVEGTITVDNPFPDGNGGFGIDSVIADVIINSQKATDVQSVYYFFPRDGSQNPTSDPNWYYYWTDAGAGVGTHQYNSGLGYAGLYTFGNNYFEIGPSAKDQGGGPLENRNGIDYFGSTCLHEKAHMDYYFASWNPYRPGQDQDNDRLKNSEEPNMTGLDGNPYNPNLTDTNSDGYTDDEDWAWKAANGWTIGSKDPVDWANPGHQY